MRIAACCKNCAHSIGSVLHPGDHRCGRLAGYPHIDEVRDEHGLCGPDAKLFAPQAALLSRGGDVLDRDGFTPAHGLRHHQAA